ncbi:type IX secretion system membrane protein PorP/SprF [bacterium]|nr:type IX secretion system membrane protein PorP/SprF [bacterium]
MISYLTKYKLVLLCIATLSITTAQNLNSQELETELDATNTYQNQLYFNRFFINPTFSLVRENKSYLNILHRNQYSSFEDNRQNYFLGFSNRLNENTALGIGVYSQWAGVVQEFGVNANYATAVRISEKNKLTFGMNLSYFTEGLDKNRILVLTEDSELAQTRKESKLAIQPGITLSLGNFDFGLYAKELFKYNQTTNSFATNLSQQSLEASVQYSYLFNSAKGIFENARFMPLLRIGKDNLNKFSYVSYLLLDLPKYGWLQANYGNSESMAFGIGINLSKKMSLGYLLEKDLLQQDTDLGWNHEVSIAYSFSKTEGAEEWTDRSTDEKIDDIVQNYEEQLASLKNKNQLSAEEEAYKMKLMMNTLAHENRLILDQLILRQDSIERAITAEAEKRFELIVNAVRSDIKNSFEANFKNSNAKTTDALAASIRSKSNLKNTETNTLEASAMAYNGVSNPRNSNINTIEALAAGFESKLNEPKVEEHRDFKEIPIKMLTQSAIEGAETGYYVIANVYKNKKYLNNFMQSLTKKGLKASQISRSLR